MNMDDKVKVILAPDDWQIQPLLDTIDMYSDVCNFVSDIVYKMDHRKPKDLYYWRVDDHHENFYGAVRSEFPDINTNFIPLAFRKVAKAYRKKRPSEAHKFNGVLNCSNYTITIKFILPSPDNIGLLTLSTLAGRTPMHFVFDDNQRKELSVAFNRKRFREYEIIYQDDKFYLISDVYDHRKTNMAAETWAMPKCTIDKLLK
jgi:hypothetical protein